MMWWNITLLDGKLSLRASYQLRTQFEFPFFLMWEEKSSTMYNGGKLMVTWWWKIKSIPFYHNSVKYSENCLWPSYTLNLTSASGGFELQTVFAARSNPQCTNPECCNLPRNTKKLIITWYIGRLEYLIVLDLEHVTEALCKNPSTLWGYMAYIRRIPIL